MDVIQMNPDELKEYQNNPRVITKDAVDKVAKSIEAFGFKVPIIIDENNVIIAGHTRRKAAKQLKLEEIPVVIAKDLSEEQIKAFRLADNKVAEYSEWDAEFLLAELEEIDANMYEFGFDELETFEPEPEPEEDTSSVDLDENVVIVVEADTEEKLEEIFTDLVEEGYKCRLLTL